MEHTLSYIQNYPRPLMTRPDWINLEGEWDFIFDEHNIGCTASWEKDFPKESKKIIVPYSYHTKNSGIFDTTSHPYMWYKKQISLESYESKRVLLHFEAVDYECKVFVNGIEVGSHIGGYNRFSFDITNACVVGDNVITLYVIDDLSKEKPRGKQRYKKENFECWYIETSGIWKTPWIEIVNYTYIKGISYKYDDSSLTYKIICENLNNFDKTVLTLSDKTNLIGMAEANNEGYIKLNLQKDIQLWSESNPKLYDVEVSIIKDGIPIDTVKSYIGFRNITVNKEILINEERPYFRMILDQGYFNENHLTAFENDLLNDLLLVKSMGFNGIRKHEKLESQIYNYYCDLLGIYTWQEMPSFYEFSELSKNRFKNEYIEMINQYINHPSIITWVPFNESWGITDVYKDKAQQDFTVEIYKLTKSLDNSRPCVTNDGWEHTKTDIVTFHNYQEYGEGLLGTYRDIDKILNNEDVTPKPPKLAFAKGYNYECQPLMMTEFAGIAFSDTKGWGYGESVKTTEDFILRLRSQIDALKDLDFFQGYCVTQLTDVQQEVNGLLTEKREPKIDIATIKNIIAKRGPFI